MNEKNKIHNPRKKVIRCIGNKVQDEKNVLNHYKNKQWAFNLQNNFKITFNLQNTQIVTFSSAIERIFLGTRAKSFCDKSFNF